MDTPQDINNHREAIAKGGTWTDENLDDTLDWQGEVTTTHPDEATPKTHTPKTARQQEDQALKQAGLSNEVIELLIKRLERRSTGTSAALQASMTSMIDEKTAAIDAKVDDWLANVKAKSDKQTADMLSAQNVKQADISRLEEKLRTLHERVDALVLSTTESEIERLAVMKEAAKIVKDRVAVDESETASTPSVVHRIEQQIDATAERLQNVEPYVSQAVATAVSAARQQASVRRKIGRLG